MSVMELEPTVCSNDGCARRFEHGWGEVCDECAALATDHAAGLHIEPDSDCHNCW